MDNVFHADVTRLPVAANSAATIQAAGPGLTLSAPSSFVWEGSRPGVPINVVDSRTTPSVNFIGGEYAYLSDLNGHPVPASPLLEGAPGAAWDKHMLIVDTFKCVSHEFFQVATWGPYWKADTAVKIDMRSNVPKVSSMASWSSMLNTMIRYEEVAAGRIDHAIGLSLPVVGAKAPVWPAFATDGRSTDPNAPAMGTWLRLKPDANLAGLGRDATVIARALQQHGAIVVDSGPPWMALGAENSTFWNDADTNTLKRLTMADFEVVDPTPMKVSNSSWQIR